MNYQSPQGHLLNSQLSDVYSFSMDPANCQFSVAKIPMIKCSLPLSSKPSTLCTVTGLTHREILGTHHKHLWLMKMMKQRTLYY